MGLVILRHGEDGDEGDRPIPALLPSRPFVQGGEVGVHIPGIAAAARHFLAGGRDLPQRVGVVGDVGQDDQHLHPPVECQVFRGSQGHTGGGDPFHGRIVRQVDEHHRPVDGAGLPEGFDEIIGFLKGDAHRREDHGEPAVVPQYRRLPRDLGRELGVGQAGC